MSRPVLVCQGFQRAFIDADSPVLSVSALMRRGVCEEILRHARTSGWSVVHTFLEKTILEKASGDSIEGFAPLPFEPYFRQFELSAFRTHGFPAKMAANAGAPVFLISLAGMGVICATFLDALQQGVPMHVVTDAVADAARSGVTESEGLNAMSAISRIFDREISAADLLTVRRSYSASYLPNLLGSSAP